jgi:4-aminobutyrate aminotransferase-like enzyme
VTAIAVRERHGRLLEKISASTSYGGNPMACAAVVATLEVIEEEGLVERSAKLGEFIMGRLHRIREAHPIVGEVRGKGCLLGMELVKDRATREPFVEAGEMVYRKAFERGVAWIPAKQNLRMSPPLIMEEDVAARALDIIEEAIGETERAFGM